jgi:hypothetical protein
LSLRECHCGKSFKTAQLCADHIQEDHQEGYRCNHRDCKKRKPFAILKSFVAHKRMHLEKRWRYPCAQPNCVYGTNERPSLLAHMAKRHGIVPEGTAGAVKCPKCGKYLSTLRYYKDFHRGSEGCKTDVEQRSKKAPPKGSI